MAMAMAVASASSIAATAAIVGATVAGPVSD